jgi:hypothetical protein
MCLMTDDQKLLKFHFLLGGNRQEKFDISRDTSHFQSASKT